MLPAKDQSAVGCGGGDGDGDRDGADFASMGGRVALCADDGPPVIEGQ